MQSMRERQKQEWQQASVGMYLEGGLKANRESTLISLHQRVAALVFAHLDHGNWEVVQNPAGIGGKEGMVAKSGPQISAQLISRISNTT